MRSSRTDVHALLNPTAKTPCPLPIRDLTCLSHAYPIGVEIATASWSVSSTEFEWKNAGHWLHIMLFLVPTTKPYDTFSRRRMKLKRWTKFCEAAKLIGLVLRTSVHVYMCIFCSGDSIELTTYHVLKIYFFIIGIVGLFFFFLFSFFFLGRWNVFIVEHRTYHF